MSKKFQVKYSKEKQVACITKNDKILADIFTNKQAKYEQYSGDGLDETTWFQWSKIKSLKNFDTYEEAFNFLFQKWFTNFIM